MSTYIKEISLVRLQESIDIFTEAFVDDPLFKFAFPEEATRLKQTRVMYEFVVNEMVPLLNLSLVGAFSENNRLVGCMVFSTPERIEWGGQMNDSLSKMRNKSNDERINLIGEFAVLEGIEHAEPYFYGNELAVSKEFQGKGIGKALTRHLINECIRNPSSKGIAIDTASERNVKKYEKWGWEITAVRDFYDIKKYFLWRRR